MRKRLYRMAYVGLAAGMISSTISVMAVTNTQAEPTEETEYYDESTELNAGVSRALSDLMVSVTYEPVQTVVVTEPEETNPYEPFSYEEAYLLTKIAMAEAEGEDITGKVLVIETVLNRVSSSEFPNSIEEVIYEKNQFTPILDGRFNRVEPNDDCWEAFYIVTGSEDDISQGALYFESCSNSDNWHSRNLQFLFQHGNSNFYK